MAGTVTQYQNADFTYKNNANGDLTQVYFSTIASQVSVNDGGNQIGQDVQSALEYIVSNYATNSALNNKLNSSNDTATNITFNGTNTVNGYLFITGNAGDNKFRTRGISGCETSNPQALSSLYLNINTSNSLNDYMARAVYLGGSSANCIAVRQDMLSNAFSVTTYSALATTNQTIVGAINEVNTDISTVSGNLSTLQSDFVSLLDRFNTQEEGLNNGTLVVNSATNAVNATQLTTTRTFSITGDVTALAQNFNGTQNVVLTTTLADSGVSAGNYSSVTVNNKGIVTAGGSILVCNTVLSTAYNLQTGGLFFKKNQTGNVDTEGEIFFRGTNSALYQFYPATNANVVTVDSILGLTGTTVQDYLNSLNNTKTPQIILTNANNGKYRVKTAVAGQTTEKIGLRLAVIITYADQLLDTDKLQFCVYKKSNPCRKYTDQAGTEKRRYRTRYRFKKVQSITIGEIRQGFATNADSSGTHSINGVTAYFYTMTLPPENKILRDAQWNYTNSSALVFGQKCIRIRGEDGFTKAFTKFSLKYVASKEEYIVVNY